MNAIDRILMYPHPDNPKYQTDNRPNYIICPICKSLAHWSNYFHCYDCSSRICRFHMRPNEPKIKVLYVRREINGLYRKTKEIYK